MARWTTKKPIRAKHRRLFGRLWCRYTCGTCGSRSWWVRPYKAQLWISKHKDRSPVCYQKEAS